jgi:hypothetical protein
MTMRFVSLSTLAAAVILAATSSASSAAAPAPTGLHGFLLRADEPATTTYNRTPSFAWDPFPAAAGYQFQISTSGTFRENGTVYNTNSLTTPVAAPSIVLPWITGSPHSLYARVRATTAAGVTPWSAVFGFDVTPPPPPTPLPSDPGLLRWTPVPGASAYQVWFIDAPKKTAGPGLGKETVRTNVLDEREFYAFHQSQKWIGTVRWRIRAQRSTAGGTPLNGLPAVTYGAWSPVYSSTNPAVTGGPIKLVHTISDVSSDGSTTSPAHRLMTGFAWTGNQSLSGTAAELYRVYVFTDSQCLNLVYSGALVGSQSYAPRPDGPLAMPQDSSGITKARAAFLDDGTESGTQMYDGTPVTAQEQRPPAVPTSIAPLDPTPAGPAAAAAAPSAAPPAAPSSGPAAAPTSVGAPVNLWDTDWPQSGYYWTVVPVATVSASVGSSTVAAPGASKGSSLVPVSDVSQFVAGQSITIGIAPNSDTSTIAAIGAGLITLAAPLNNGHGVGEPISSTVASSILYRDLEMPQDVCAAGRVQRFGISSEPSLTTAQEPFATGLSATGRLISAAHTRTFYGQPLVAWTPALGAQNYQVQWGKKAYPFTAQGSSLTASTSTVLPLTPGVWWYRVRGFDYNLPTGVQQMSWSEPEKLVVSAPTFKVTPAPKTKFKVVGKP